MKSLTTKLQGGITVVKMPPFNQPYPKSDVISGVDWLTATATDDKVGIAWYSLLLSFADDNRKSYPLEDARNRWYDGRKCGPVFWGHSLRQGYIIQVTGQTANDFWSKVCPIARNVSRVDLQVTARDGRHRPKLLNAYENSVAQIDKVEATYWRRSRGGQTLYCGSRNSDSFGRVYDKGVEQKGAAGYVYRYEVQHGGAHAQDVGKWLASKTLAGESAAVEIAAHVHQWFSVRGCRPIFVPSNPEAVIGVGRVVTTVDRKLEWLRSQVAPTMLKLVSMGLGDEVREAIGATQLQF